ncbi:MAG: LptF/LptG family permease [Bacteroidales bacterium]|nr:LptF/LptG family permease [Bacteroidales bacterium]
MKKLDRLILRSFFGPLLLTFLIAVFVLLMQFVWKYIDDMVGKGLSFGVIAELLFYASATFVPMALPIAVLFASIMTMGNFGEKYELVAMKAGGVSIRRVMRPMLLVVLVLTGIAFYFANNVLPAAMVKYKVTLFDVQSKKPAFNIKPSEYYSDIDGYVIRANTKDADGRTMHDIIIYDHSQQSRQASVIVAQDGVMQMSPDERYLVFTLHHGSMYTEEYEGAKYYSLPFTHIDFDTQALTFDLSSFAFNKTDDQFFKGNYQMMNIGQLRQSIASLEDKRGQSFEDGRNLIREHLATMHYVYNNEERYETSQDPIFFSPQAMNGMSRRERRYIIEDALSNESSAMGEMHTLHSIDSGQTEYINRHHIEWQRKYTLSLACIVLFLVGAPFGSIVRKGGLGLPLVASVLFFVVYYMIGMIAEKSVRESALGPEGMWVSTLVMLPIGLLLTYYATSDGARTIRTTLQKLFTSKKT